MGLANLYLMIIATMKDIGKMGNSVGQEPSTKVMA